MKRVIKIMLCALMTFSLTACEGLEELLGDKFGDILEDVIGGGEEGDNEEGENVYPSESIPIKFEGVEYIPYSYWVVYQITTNKSNSAVVNTQNYNPDEHVIVHFGFGKRMELYKGMEQDGEVLIYYDGIYGEWELDEDDRTMTITPTEGAPKTYRIDRLRCNDIFNGEMVLTIKERVSEQPDGEGSYDIETRYNLLGRNSEYFTFMGGSFPGGSQE